MSTPFAAAMESPSQETECSRIVRWTCEELFKTQAFFLLSAKALSKAVPLFRRAQKSAVSIIKDIPTDAIEEFCIKGHRLSFPSAQVLGESHLPLASKSESLLLDHTTFEPRGRSYNEKMEDLLDKTSRHGACQTLASLRPMLSISVEALENANWAIGQWKLKEWQKVLTSEADEESWTRSFLAAQRAFKETEVLRTLPKEGAAGIAVELEDFSFEEMSKVVITMAEITAVLRWALEKQEGLELARPRADDSPIATSDSCLNAMEKADVVLSSVDRVDFEKELLSLVGITLWEMTPDLREGLGLLGQVVTEHEHLVATEREWQSSPWSGELFLYGPPRQMDDDDLA